jgi:hypothetical protein
MEGTMQAAHAKIRRTPFGDCYGYRPERPNPFNVRTRERNGTRRAPRLVASKLAQIRPELDRLGLSSETLFGTRIAYRRHHTGDLYRIALRLSWTVLRLALRGSVAHVLEKMRRAAQLQLGRRGA